jgi:hypothetical protein
MPYLRGTLNRTIMGLKVIIIDIINNRFDTFESNYYRIERPKTPPDKATAK